MSIPLSGALTLGWFGLPALAVRGPAAAFVTIYAVAGIVMGGYVLSGRAGLRLRADLAGDILRVGLFGCAERRLGRDVPVYVQYGRWVGGIFLRGTLGQSLMGGDTVEQSIAQRLPVTLQLGLMAILIGLVIAVPVGIYSAIRQDTTGDYVGRSLAILGLATPNFWLATMVIVFPAIWWRWAPPLVLTSFAEDPLRSLAGFAVPSLILGTYLSAATMRMTRTMMLEVLRQDYIRTAWSKGLLERSVILRHAVKNTLIPVVSLVALQVPILVGGSVIIENIFNLPGLGRCWWMRLRSETTRSSRASTWCLAPWWWRSIWSPTSRTR